MVKYRALEEGRPLTKAMDEARDKCRAIRQYNTAVTQHRASVKKASSAAKRPREDHTSRKSQYLFFNSILSHFLNITPLQLISNVPASAVATMMTMTMSVLPL